MAAGSNIAAADYNSIQSKIFSVLGTGSGTFGYGQPLSSSPVAAGNTITAVQWQQLYNDLVSAKLHQEDNIPNLFQVIKGTPIRFDEGNPVREYDRIADQCIAARFNIGIGRSLVVSDPNTMSNSRTGPWSIKAQCEITITFPDAESARHFFNAGGKIRTISSRTGGSLTAQNNAWTSILSSAGAQEFSGNIANIENFYTLTDQYRTFYIRSLSTPYSANFYKLEAKTNVANNSTGTASILTIRTTWQDDYIDPDVASGFPADTNPPIDQVDGTLSISVEEVKAIGNLIPLGQFTITSPSYTVGTITLD